MWKIDKIVATRCHILRLKCTKFNFGWGSAADPAVGVYSAPPDPLGATSKEREGRGGERRAGKGKGTPWFLLTPPDVESWIKPCTLPSDVRRDKALIEIAKIWGTLGPRPLGWDVADPYEHLINVTCQIWSFYFKRYGRMCGNPPKGSKYAKNTSRFSWSFKVIGTDTSRPATRDFLLVIDTDQRLSATFSVGSRDFFPNSRVFLAGVVLKTRMIMIPLPCIWQWCYQGLDMQGQGQGPSLQEPGQGLDLQGQGLDSRGPGQGQIWSLRSP